MGTPLPGVYLDACQLLEDTYAPVDPAVEAREKVRTDKQKEGQSFAKFVEENRGYSPRSGFGDVALIDALKHAMHWRLRTEVGREWIQPLNWKQWIRFAIEQEA